MEVFALDLDVYYLAINNDINIWRELLTQAELTFTDARVRGVRMYPGQDLYNSIRDMVPWEITHMSYVRRPKARRLPINAPWSHRAVIRSTSDDRILIETDARSELAFPCLRFPEDSEAAFFVYGHAPESGLEPHEKMPSHD